MAMGKSDCSEKTQMKSKKKEKDVLPTKVVMRRLPPTFTEEKLKEILNGIPEYNYFRFVEADNSFHPHVFSRAYINFRTFDHVLQFRNAYDGYIFNDGNGNEYSAVVELSAYQGIPKEGRRRKDPKCGTITKDPDYEAFLEALDQKVEPLPSAEIYIEEMESKNEKDAAAKQQVPLVEFLNKKRAFRNRQNNTSLSESERRLKREKDNLKEASKGSKSDRKSNAKDARKEKTESTKTTQDKKAYDSKRKDEGKDRKSTSGRKSRNDRNIRDQKDQRRESKRDVDDLPLSARSDSSRSNESKAMRRDGRREKDDKWDDRKNRIDKQMKKDDDQKKPIRTNQIKDNDERVRRKSIEHEDPSIVAFGKTSDSKKDSSNDASNKADKNIERKYNYSEDKERIRNEIDKRTKNRDRPSQAVYRPPVARQDRNKTREERMSPEKSRIKSPENSRSPEKRNRTSDKSYGKERSRFRQKETDGNNENEPNRT